MENTLSGGCLCGAVRYEVTGEPINSFFCHCRDCQRHFGSAFFPGIRVSMSALRVVQGTLAGYRKVGASGNEITRQFCPTCGSSLFTIPAKMPDSIAISVSTLDDPTVFHPRVHIWAHAEWDWARLEDGLSRWLDGNPPE